MSIEVAVIPAAGRGTRMRPATRVVPKALLTVIDRPAIQYSVEEAARAGAKEAVVVVDLDAGHLLAQHFNIEGPLPGLEDIQLRPVVQEEPLGLGHAVNEAAHMVGDRPFFCLLSDNIVRPGHDVLASLGEGSRDGSVSVMCLRELTEEFLSKYGVVVPASELEDRYLDLAGAVEKPGPANAPVAPRAGRPLSVHSGGLRDPGRSRARSRWRDPADRRHQRVGCPRAPPGLRRRGRPPRCGDADRPARGVGGAG